MSKRPAPSLVVPSGKAKQLAIRRLPGSRRIQIRIGRADLVLSRDWYWLGAERCGGRLLIGLGFGRLIL